METAMEVDPAYAALSDEVRVASEALVAFAKQHPDQWWDPYELKTRAEYNGWSVSAMSLALNRLIAARV
jgi:hypothetical protein